MYGPLLGWEGDSPVLYFHRYQRRAIASRARFVAMLAGTQGGKTVTGPPWLWQEIGRKGPGDYLAVTTTYDLFKLKMLPAMQEFFVHILQVGRYWAGLGVIEIAHPQKGFLARRQDDPMWARIIMRAVSSPRGLEAATANAAWLDEAGMPEWDVTHWEAVLRRLSKARGRALLTTTVYNEGWLKSEIWEPWEEGDPDIEVVQFPSIANPSFPREEFERAQERMPEWRFRMFYLGQFATPPHLVYQLPPDFWVEPFEVPADWPVVVGVDFGGVNTARVALAQDPETGVWYVFHEWLGGNLSTPEHVELARKQYAPWLEAGTLVAFGGSPSEEQWRVDWSVAGFPIFEPPVPGLEERIEAVRRLIREGKLKAFSHLRGLRHEFATYRRKMASDGTILDTIQDKERFHRLDALGYAVNGIVYGEMEDPILFAI